MKTPASYFSKDVQWTFAYTVFLLAVYYVIRVLVFPNNVPDNRNMYQIHVIYALSGVFIFFLWFFMRFFRKLPILAVLFCGPVICMFTDLLHTEASILFLDHKFSWQFEQRMSFSTRLRQAYTGSLFYLSWYLGYFGILYHFRFVKEALAASEARAQTQAAQLQMLRYQLNPHFLFNTLNSISSLVLSSNNASAEKMIGNLSRFLRFTLDKPPNIKITLEEELSIVKEYLAIEKVRFSDRLDTRFQIIPDSLQCLVPSLILQPAVENAIKHAISSAKSGGTILITSEIQEQTLLICIADNGPGLPPQQKQAGVGMENMRGRLTAMYGENTSLKLTSNRHNGVSVHISIPVEYTDLIP